MPRERQGQRQDEGQQRTGTERAEAAGAKEQLAMPAKAQPPIESIATVAAVSASTNCRSWNDTAVSASTCGYSDDRMVNRRRRQRNRCSLFQASVAWIV